MSTSPRTLESLRNADALRPLLPPSLQDRTIEVDLQEPEPNRNFVANLVEEGDRSTVASISIGVPTEPLGPDAMHDDESIYAAFNSPFVFQRLPEDHRSEFGDNAYTRTTNDDPARPGWALFSDAVSIGLIYPGAAVSESDLWNMATDIKQYLVG